MMKRFALAVIILILGLMPLGCNRKTNDSRLNVEATIFWLELKNKKKNQDLVIETGPLIEILEELKKQAKIEEKVTIRKFSENDELYLSDGNAMIGRSGDNRSYIVSVSKHYYGGGASVKEVRAMLAHELGHLKRGHLDNTQLSAGKNDEIRQTEADIFAISLVGRKNYEEWLKNMLFKIFGNDCELEVRMTRVDQAMKSRKKLPKTCGQLLGRFCLDCGVHMFHVKHAK